jgi:hypothetical protein
MLPDVSHLLEPCGSTRPAPAGSRGFPSDTSRSTSRGLTGQGPAGFRRPAPPVWRFTRTRRAIRWAPYLFRDTAPATRASPQPDPLGHLMSHNHGALDGESSAVRPPWPTRRSELARYASVITPRKPSSSRMNESVGLTWSRARPLSRIATNRAEGRFTRASAKKPEIDCTRGAFHRRATRTWETEAFALASTVRWGLLHKLSPTCGERAAPLPYRQTHAPTREP